MVSMYSEKVLARAGKIKYAEELPDPDAVGEVVNLGCGDELWIYLKVKDGKIEKIRFKTYGCLAAVVSTDCLCELAEGKTLDEAEKITGEDIIRLMGSDLPPLKMHCFELSLEALKRAINNCRKNSKKDLK